MIYRRVKPYAEQILPTLPEGYYWCVVTDYVDRLLIVSGRPVRYLDYGFDGFLSLLLSPFMGRAGELDTEIVGREAMSKQVKFTSNHTLVSTADKMFQEFSETRELKEARNKYVW